MNESFVSLLDCPEGTLAGMLAECYGSLLQEMPEQTAAQLRRSWREFDRAVHQEPETMGACGFVTIVENRPAGFATWDPRKWPKVGRVGHNCVRPRYQRHGLGRRQILRLLAQLGAQGFAKVEARTDEHPFFEPARRMYESCGFRVAELADGTLAERYATVVYEVALNPVAV